MAILLRTKKRTRYLVSGFHPMRKSPNAMRWSSSHEVSKLSLAIRLLKSRPCADQIDAYTPKGAFCMYYKDNGRVVLNQSKKDSAKRK